MKTNKLKDWQLTKAQWAEKTRSKLAPTNDWLKAHGFSGETAPNMSAHYWQVRHAIVRGDPVPANVRADYPELCYTETRDTPIHPASRYDCH